MSEEYNEWYWKLYRWWKWEAKHVPRDIAKGFKNLWKWFPIIWKDRDWDNHFIFEALKFKLKNTANYLVKYDRYVGVEDDVRYIRICEKLIQRIQDDYYQMEYQDYIVQEMYTVDGSLEFKTIKDNSLTFIKQHPNTYKKVVANPKYKSYIQNNNGTCLAIGIERHLKARKLLFKILEEKIEGWWD
jgi:hypothetical protein